MLTFPEELLLLALDDRKGVLKPLPAQTLQLALTGGLLLELALCGRIDTDLDALRVVSTAPTGQELPDEVLDLLKKEKTPHPASRWLRALACDLQDLEDRVLAQLVAKGVLKVENRRILWVFHTRRYPMMDGKEVLEVRTRLRELIGSDAIPEPRDAVLVGLVHACHLFGEVFSEEELARLEPRIRNLARLELIGREVNRAITDLAISITESMAASISGIV